MTDKKTFTGYRKTSRGRNTSRVTNANPNFLSSGKNQQAQLSRGNQTPTMRPQTTSGFCKLEKEVISVLEEYLKTFFSQKKGASNNFDPKQSIIEYCSLLSAFFEIKEFGKDDFSYFKEDKEHSNLNENNPLFPDTPIGQVYGHFFNYNKCFDEFLNSLRGLVEKLLKDIESNPNRVTIGNTVLNTNQIEGIRNFINSAKDLFDIPYSGDTKNDGTVKNGTLNENKVLFIAACLAKEIARVWTEGQKVDQNLIGELKYFEGSKERLKDLNITHKCPPMPATHVNFTKIAGEWPKIIASGRGCVTQTIDKNKAKIGRDILTNGQLALIGFPSVFCYTKNGFTKLVNGKRVPLKNGHKHNLLTILSANNGIILGDAQQEDLVFVFQKLERIALDLDMFKIGKEKDKNGIDYNFFRNLLSKIPTSKENNDLITRENVTKILDKIIEKAIGGKVSKDILNKINELKKRNENIETELKEKKERLNKLQKEKNELKKQNNDLAAENERLKKEKEKMGELKQLEQSVKEGKSAELRDFGTQTTVSMAEHEKLEKELKALKDEKAKLEEAKQKAEKEKEDAEKKIKDLEATLVQNQKEIDKLKAKTTELKKQLNEGEGDKEKLQKELAEANKKLEELKAEKAELEKAKLEKAKQKAKEAKQKAKEAEQKAEEAKKYVEEQIKDLKAKLEENQTNINELNAKITELKKQLDEGKGDKEKLQKELTEVKNELKALKDEKAEQEAEEEEAEQEAEEERNVNNRPKSAPAEEEDYSGEEEENTILSSAIYNYYSDNSTNGEEEEERDQLREKNKGLKDLKNDLEAKLEKAKQETEEQIKGLKAKLEENQTNINELNAKIAKLQEELNKEGGNKEKLQEEFTEAELEKAEQEAEEEKNVNPGEEDYSGEEEEERDQLREKNEELKDSKNDLEVKLEKAKQEVEKKIKDLEAKLAQNKEEIDKLNAKIAKLEEEELNKEGGNKEKLQEELAKTKNELEELKAKEAELEKTKQDAEEQIKGLEAKLKKLQKDIEDKKEKSKEHQAEIEQLKTRARPIYNPSGASNGIEKYRIYGDSSEEYEEDANRGRRTTSTQTYFPNRQYYSSEYGSVNEKDVVYRRSYIYEPENSPYTQNSVNGQNACVYKQPYFIYEKTSNNGQIPVDGQLNFGDQLSYNLLLNSIVSQTIMSSYMLQSLFLPRQENYKNIGIGADNLYGGMNIQNPHHFIGRQGGFINPYYYDMYPFYDALSMCLFHRNYGYKISDLPGYTKYLYGENVGFRDLMSNFNKTDCYVLLGNISNFIERNFHTITKEEVPVIEDMVSALKTRVMDLRNREIRFNSLSGRSHDVLQLINLGQAFCDINMNLRIEGRAM